MKPSEVEKFLRMARAYATQCLPWFSSALFQARLVLTKECPSIAAIDDGLRVYYNADLVGDFLKQHQNQRDALKQLAWVWTHEISHFLRDHSTRAQESNAESYRWNIAGDMEINDCYWHGMGPPFGWEIVLPDIFGLCRGQLAEFYYRHLTSLDCEKLLPADPARSQTGPLFDEGSGVHGVPRPWELPEITPENPAMGEGEKHSVRRQVAENLLGDKSRGDIPGHWLRWAETICKSEVDWRTLLKRRVRAAVACNAGQKTDYSMQRPHRRAAVYRPFLRPTLNSTFNPRVACVVDTSGSMGELELSQVLAEVRAVLQAMRIPITVIPCDSVAYAPIEILTASDFLKLRKGMRGGGGTNMCAGIDAALKLKPAPDLVLVLTDGETPYPPQPLQTPVIFGILQGQYSNYGQNRPRMPPWREKDVVTIKIHHPGLEEWEDFKIGSRRRKPPPGKNANFLGRSYEK